MRLVFLFISFLALAGCADMAQQRALQQAQEARSQVDAVCERIATNPESAPLFTSVPVYPSKATIKQLADTTRPTDQQKAIIAKIDEYKAPCVAAEENYLQQYAPSVAPIFTKLQQDIKLLWAHLLSGEINFGRFNSERARISAAASAAAQSSESARVAQAQQMQMQRYQNYLQLQQNLNGLRPRTTNCYQYGNSMNCTQY